MAEGLEREWLALERERLREAVRQREEELRLEALRLQPTTEKPPGFWRELGSSFAAGIPIITALITTSAGLWQFGLLQKQGAVASAEARTREAELRAETERREARKAFDAKRLSLYEKAISVSGRLASDPISSPAFEQARRDFERLYWAELPLVESKGVAGAMVKLRARIALRQPSAEDINQGVIDLAHAVRVDLRDVYGDSEAAATAPVDAAAGPPASEKPRAAGGT